ncbi:MAG: SpoIIE family protein phosphatase [Chloroflexales bacterium]|nr:SpoIIE family protein phosphatase [Chloroflexales bacterium]
MSALLQRLTAWRRARLTRRITVPAIIVTLLFLAVLGFVAFRLGQRAVIEQVDARNRQLAVQVSGEIATFFQTQIDTLRLQGDRTLDTSDPERQGDALVKLRSQFPYVYNDLRLFDAGGREAVSATGRLTDLVTSGAARPAAPGAPDPTVLTAMAERALVISPVGFRPITGTPYVTATLPLLRCDPDETPCAARGALQAQIDLRSFWTRVDGIRIENGAVTIVDNTGLIIAHPDRRQVGGKIAETSIAPLFAGFEGSTTYTRGDTTYLAAYAPVGAPLGWGVTVEQERGAALRLVGTIGWATTLATLVSALALTLLLSSLIRRALHPIDRLSRAAAAIAASGDLSAGPAVGAPDEADSKELATLSDSFNQMIARLRAAQEHLERWNEQLERRVNERTAQLQTVLEIARLSAGTLSEQAVLTTLLSQIGRLVEFDAATIRLLDAGGEHLETVAVEGVGAANLPRRVALANSGIHAHVVRERATCLVPNTAADAEWQASLGPNAEIGSWLAVPLVAQERPVGVISVYAAGPGRYGPEEAALLGALGSQVAVTLSNARLYEESVRRVDGELQTARQIQKHLFPARAPTLSGLDIATFYRAARETTGDFYSFVTPARQGEVGGHGRDVVDLFIGDVSGKSLPAALLMTMARTALYAAASASESGPVETLLRANEVLVGDMPRGSFVASTFARLDRQAGTCTLVNAAQPAPLLVRAGRTTLLEGPGGHLPLGIVREPAYEPLTVRLQQGDLLLFYTDGVIEAFSPGGELFGFERLEATMVTCDHAHAPAVVESLMAAVGTWMGSAPQHDDIAILAVRVTEGWG